MTDDEAEEFHFRNVEVAFLGLQVEIVLLQPFDDPSGAFPMFFEIR